MSFLLFGLKVIIARFVNTGGLPRCLILKCFTKRSLLVVAPWVVRFFGFIIGGVRCDLAQRVLERRFFIKPTVPPFFNGSLQPLLLAAVLLGKLVPQLFFSFRIPCSDQIVVLEFDWSMFRRPAQDSVDLFCDPL